MQTTIQKKSPSEEGLFGFKNSFKHSDRYQDKAQSKFLFGTH